MTLEEMKDKFISYVATS